MRCIGQAGRRRGRAREAGPPGRVCKPAGGVAPNGVTGARRCAASPSPPLLAGGLTDTTQTPLGYILTLSADLEQPVLAVAGVGADLGRPAAALHRLGPLRAQHPVGALDLVPPGNRNRLVSGKKGG